jgi:predicted ABC-type ATPase
MTTEKPKLLIIAGPNGSGKTSVTGPKSMLPVLHNELWMAGTMSRLRKS